MWNMKRYVFWNITPGRPLKSTDVSPPSSESNYKTRRNLHESRLKAAYTEANI
jgi:hypothetical protein